MKTGGMTMSRDYGYALMLMEKIGIENMEIPTFHDPGMITDEEWDAWIGVLEGL